MSNIKVVKVDSINLGGTKKTKKSRPANIEYLQNIVREKKAKFEPNKNLDLANTDMITNLLSKKQSKKNFEVRKATEAPKSRVEAPKAKVEVPKAKVEALKAKVEAPKVKVEAPKAKVEAPKVKKDRKLNKRRAQLPKKVGKKTSKREIISFFTKEDQKKMRTKRDKKLISSNLVAPKIEKKTKKNLYKIAVRNILKKDKKNRKEIEGMTRNQLLEELSNKGIIEENSKAPLKILRDLYHLLLLTEVNISK